MGATSIIETYDDVRGLLQTTSWEVMDEDQRDDVIAKIVVPRWGKVTADGVTLKGTEWGKLLGVNGRTVIEPRVRRLRASDQEGSAPSPQPTLSQRGQVRGAKAAIRKHPELAGALLADPEVVKATTQALIDKGDIDTLSRATAAVAKNRQVDRNRKRREEGSPKGRSVLDPKPQVGGDLPPGEKAGLNAFFSVRGLSDALRALVTTFPQEWAALSDAAREDEDFRGSCEEALDKIDIALAHCRSLVMGGVSEAELQSILDGGA